MTSLKSGVNMGLMKKLSLYVFLGLMFCNVSFGTILGDILKKFGKTPPAELFGIKLLENINKYSKDKILSFDNLENVYGDAKINAPYLQKIRWISGDDLVVIKNDKFDMYNLYVNDKLKVEGIDATNHGELFDEDKKFLNCLNAKTELINKIVKLYDLDINNFKVQNYVFSNDDMPEEKNNIISQSVFKFNHDGIDLSYGLACEIYMDKKKSTLWIELFTEKLDVAIYSQNYSKSEKSIEQLLNSDLKGI